MDDSNSPPEDPDAGLRDRLADAMAAEASFDGWTRKALAAGARRLELQQGEADRLFPGGPVQVLTHLSQRADFRTVEDMEKEGVGALKIRDRIKGAVRIRLERHAGEREAVRFGHPSGTLRVGAEARQVDGEWTVTKAVMSRSARVLMEGKVRVPAE